MEVKKALYISQEIAPYLDDTPMSSWSRLLPEGILERGAEVRTFMPKYGYINERRNQLHEVIRLSGMNLIIDDTDHPLIIKVATLQPSRMQVYFIYNDDYFALTLTKELETTTNAEDNDERSIFYVRGVIEAVRKQGWNPNIIQCSGWISALAPLYMRELYGDNPSFRDAKIVYTLWDDAFETPLNSRLGEKLMQDGLSEESVKDILGKPVDYTMLTRLALKFSDAVAICRPNIDPAIEQLAKDSGLPLLPYPGEDNYVEAFAQFYESL